MNTSMKLSGRFIFATICLAGFLLGADARADAHIALISAQLNGKTPAGHGLKKLEDHLRAKKFQVESRAETAADASDFYVLAGLSTEESLVSAQLRELKLSLPQGKEALRIRKTSFRGKPAVLLCGSDEVGLMYAALDVAQRISWSQNPQNPVEHVLDTFEKPDVKERAVSTGAFHRRYFEERFHDPKYWEAYFDMMAENRLNQFILLFGYKNGQNQQSFFTAPIYPYFFSVEGFPYVKLTGLTSAQQQANTAALKTIIALAHERGIEFGVGLWDQIGRDKEYGSLIKDDADVPPNFPNNVQWGLTQKNLVPYTKEAVKKFVKTFPEIDLIQFRMHWESGVRRKDARPFWKEVFDVLKKESPTLKIETPAKDVADEILYDGVDSGLDFRVSTKHWMEQMGMPFHPTHVNAENQSDRRHGYADLLRYPQRYGFKWRLWNGGTTRVLLWGDPDWVKQFVAGSHLYDAVSFEFNEPLFFKMNGSPHDAAVFELLNPASRYYTYEFERYWHFFQVFGRIGYNPATPADIWEMEFKTRFGSEAGPALMRALHLASQVLPRIVSASYLYERFPSPHGWPELQRMDSLPDFAKKSKPSDIQQIASPMEEAELILSGAVSPKRLPRQTSDWFQQTSAGILTLVGQAEQSKGTRSKEYLSTVTDLKILAYLSRYHSRRLAAAVSYNLYVKTGDLVSFDQAIELETQAVAAYGELVNAVGDVYTKQLNFGSSDALFPGHWSKEHQRLQKELSELRAARLAAQAQAEKAPLLAHIPVRRSRPQEPVVIAATVQPQSHVKEVRVMVSTDGGAYRAVTMQRSADGICSEEILDAAAAGEVKYYFEITEPTGTVSHIPTAGAASAYVIMISDDRQPPHADVDRITTAPVGRAVKVGARVLDVSGVKSAMLRYRRVTQFEDYQSVPMVYNAATDKYEAVIPADISDGKYDVMYFIEVMDTKGNGRMYPDMETETPYIIIHLDRNER